MMGEQPYHKYVFDIKNRKFVGNFEEMYANEGKENYDSWYQEDLTHFGKQLSLLLLSRYNFTSILDIGCGKGTFTHLLKKANNEVVGTDISETAIQKAKAKYRDIKFLKLTAEEALNLKKNWDLVILMEILSYCENWRDILSKVAEQSIYIPLHPNQSNWVCQKFYGVKN
ncbi:MAG: class I SAM-dependent methyltransferase [bacterium]